MISDFLATVFCAILGVIGWAILAGAYSWEESFPLVHPGDVNEVTGLFFLVVKGFGWLFMLCGALSLLSYVRSKEQRRKREAAIDKFLRQ